MQGDDVPVDGRAPGYFRRCAEVSVEQLAPLPIALSGWGDDHIRGSAVTGALARSAEAVGRKRPDLRPVRSTVDLQRPGTMSTATTGSTVVREGRRLLLVDSEFVQDGGCVARARTLFLPAADEDVADPPWLSGQVPSSPPEGLRPVADEGLLFFSEGQGWTANAADHQNSERKQVWRVPFPVVQGEAVTPFQAAAAIADLTNLVTHWSTSGVHYINADVTLALARLPEERGIPGKRGIGVSAAERLGSGALSAGTAKLYDQRGVFGITTVSTILQSDRSVDTVAQLMHEQARSATTRPETGPEGGCR